MTTITRSTRLGYATTTSARNENGILKMDLPDMPQAKGTPRQVLAAMQDVARHGGDYGIRVWLGDQVIGGRHFVRGDLAFLAGGQTDSITL